MITVHTTAESDPPFDIELRDIDPVIKGIYTDLSADRSTTEAAV